MMLSAIRKYGLIQYKSIVKYFSEVSKRFN
jgi:hypothetical protein